jgi:hypothetical protein
MTARQLGRAANSSLLQGFASQAGPVTDDPCSASALQQSIIELQAAFTAALSRSGQNKAALDAVSAQRLQQIAIHMGHHAALHMVAALLLTDTQIRQLMNIAVSPGGRDFSPGDTAMLQEHLLMYYTVWQSVASSLQDRTAQRKLRAVVKDAADDASKGLM